MYAGWFQKTLGESFEQRFEGSREERLTEMWGEETADAKSLRLKNIMDI